MNRQQEIKRQKARALDELGVTYNEWYVLGCLAYNSHPQQRLINTTRAWACDDGKPIEPETAAQSIQEVMSRGWIREVAESDVAKMAETLAAASKYPPLHELPEPGHITLTAQGVMVFTSIVHATFGFDWFSRGVHAQLFFTDNATAELLYCTSREHLDADITESLSQPGAVVIQEPMPLTRWYVTWWLWFSSGYMAVVLSPPEEDPPED